MSVYQDIPVGPHRLKLVCCGGQWATVIAWKQGEPWIWRANSREAAEAEFERTKALIERTIAEHEAAA